MQRAPSLPVLVLLTVFVVVMGSQRAGRPMVSVAASQTPSDESATQSDPDPPHVDHNWPGELRQLEQNYLFKWPLLHTEIPDRPRRQIITYNIASGDSISAIAKRF